MATRVAVPASAVAPIGIPASPIRVASAVCISSTMRVMVCVRAVAICVGLYSRRWRVGLEAFILLSDIDQKVFAQFFRSLDFLGVWSGDMEIHGLIRLGACAVLHEAAAAAFDLDPTTCLLLDVLNISAAMANHLSSEIEAWNRFHVDWYMLFGPFALQAVR